MSRRVSTFFVLALNALCDMAAASGRALPGGGCTIRLEATTIDDPAPYVIVTADTSCTNAFILATDVDWGDGTRFSAGAGILNLSHEYRIPGDYEARMNIYVDEVFGGKTTVEKSISITVPPPHIPTPTPTMTPTASPTATTTPTLTLTPTVTPSPTANGFQRAVSSLLEENSEPPLDEQGDGVLDAADVWRLRDEAPPGS